MDLKKISHSHLNIRGLNLHIAQAGDGELGTVVFLHGFPEIWYSWRHQMVAAADAGFRAIAPDLPGYGLSEAPSDSELSWEDLTATLLALLDMLGVPKIFLVGKDFGAKPVFDFALLHPGRVLGVVTLGVPFLPRANPTAAQPPEGFYIARWREPGRAEADFGRFDTKTVIRNIYILFSGSELPIAEEGQEIMDLVDPSAPLPPWFTQEDLQEYTDLYVKSGFKSALQIPYRSLHKYTEIADPKIEVPALLIMGEKDYILRFSGLEDYVRSGTVKDFVPDLDVAFVPEGTHFPQEQFPGLVNRLLVEFLGKHVSARS
ncbi:uncharacterized protein M6B38_304515 [Iris pallida]|uniref:AB hydrolase-1 domain-containing protein n=1 Tax=Iris pallida TaxID=29817 RepID=A0AAX6HNL4_IRIPA|nr:uncharacterized protein M6B38_304515 [Iris pallida]